MRHVGSLTGLSWARGQADVFDRSFLRLRRRKNRRSWSPRTREEDTVAGWWTWTRAAVTRSLQVSPFALRYWTEFACWLWLAGIWRSGASVGCLIWSCRGSRSTICDFYVTEFVPCPINPSTGTSLQRSVPFGHTVPSYCTQYLISFSSVAELKKSSR